MRCNTIEWLNNRTAGCQDCKPMLWLNFNPITPHNFKIEQLEDFTQFAFWSLLNLDPCCILIHVAFYPRCILIYVVSWSSMHLDPGCILTLIAPWSMLHLDPRCILILIASWSMLHLDPHCILIHVASWSSLHLDPCCIMLNLDPLNLTLSGAGGGGGGKNIPPLIVLQFPEKNYWEKLPIFFTFPKYENGWLGTTFFSQITFSLVGRGPKWSNLPKFHKGGPCREQMEGKLTDQNSWRPFTIKIKNTRSFLLGV